LFIDRLEESSMSRKYTASNQNVPPPEVVVGRWASIVETMVNFALCAALLVYAMVPAMLGKHVFGTLSAAIQGAPSGDVAFKLADPVAKEVMWISALSFSLSVYVALYVAIWALFSAFRWSNVRFFINSLLCVSVCSGEILRMVGAKLPLPPGVEAPILFLSGWVDIPMVATSGFLEGLRYSVLAPFTLVGMAGIVLALYRIGKARIDRKLAKIAMPNS
jgi:hypothetical protein